MGIIIGIIAVVAIVIIFSSINKKIDKEEEQALKTPGVAQYIRSNFPDIVNCVSSAPGFAKEFERTDCIRFYNASIGKKVLLQQWSGKLRIAVIKNDSVIKEWNIGKNDMSSLLISEIERSLGVSSKSYWENYKSRAPYKAQAILKLTKIDMAKQSDKAAKEIVESIERWSTNTGKPISELKNSFIDSALSEFGTDNFHLVLDKMKSSKMSQEALDFGIAKEHTITRFMIDALEEYLHQHPANKSANQSSPKNQKRSYKILDFYLDCSHCHEQENELKKYKLALPVQVVSVEDEGDLVAKYHVNSLPKLILVDNNGNEIKRWLGVTPASEINDYLFDNGYAVRKDPAPVNDEDDEDDPDIPKPLSSSLTAAELARLQSPEYQDKLLSIMADGGTKEQTMVKMELLLGKRQKTEAMLALEAPIRELYRRLYDEAGQSAKSENSNQLLAKLAVTNAIMDVYNHCNNDSEFLENKEKMLEIANQYGISVNLIEKEEMDRAMAIYRDGKVL